jgi:hypothetical protein
MHAKKTAAVIHKLLQGARCTNTNTVNAHAICLRMLTAACITGTSKPAVVCTAALLLPCLPQLLLVCNDQQYMQLLYTLLCMCCH